MPRIVPGNHFLVTRFVPGNHFLETSFVPGNHFLETSFVPGNHFLETTITRVFCKNLILRVKMKFPEIFNMFSVVTSIPQKSDKLPPDVIF